MVSLDNAVIARFQQGEVHFEILVDPNLAFDLKQGRDVRLSDLLAIDKVFKDAGKGTEQSPEVVAKTFHSNKLDDVVKQIILNGEVQWTTEQKKEMRERKFREIISFISTNAINPQTKTPHPPARIENALNELHITVDPFKQVKDQLPDILKELKKLLPISLEKSDVAVRIPAMFTGKALAVLHEFTIKKEEWQADGSLILLIEIPAGLRTELSAKVGKLTIGKGECKFL